MAPANRDPRVTEIIQGIAPSVLPEGLRVLSSPLRVPPSTEQRLAHFSEEVFDLRPESHLSRFLKVLIGESGAGDLRKRYILRRLQESLSGTRFFQIDRFYGALFGNGRRVAERLAVDPHGYATPDEWDAALNADSSYRSRMEQFARAANLCATPAGIETVSEALLGIDVDVYEGWISADRYVRTWADLATAYTTYTGLAGFTYDTMEAGGTTIPNDISRWGFTVAPRRALTPEEHYDLVRTLMVLKPADAIFSVNHFGLSSYNEVPIRNVDADSVQWAIRSRLSPTKVGLYGVEGFDSIVPVGPPYGLNRTGEAWSYIPETKVVISYGIFATERWQPAVIQAAQEPMGEFNACDSIMLSDGQTVFFPAHQAVTSYSQIQAGRASSDGVMVSHPYPSAGPSDSLDSTVTSQRAPEVTIDNVTLTDLYTDDDSTVAPGSPSSGPTNQFWATPCRMAGDYTVEVFEIRLRDRVPVNHLTTDIARFPHRAFFEAWDDESGGWVRIGDENVLDAFPQRIGPADPTWPVHWQHSFVGHWKTISIPFIEPVLTNRIRVCLQRITEGVPPVDENNLPLAYSLGLRNFDVGFRVRSEDDVPWQPVPTAKGFASSLDVHGSRVYFLLDRKAPESVLTEAGEWRSEMLPVPDAAVSLFLDTRDAQGQPQVIDRLWIDPVTPGVPFHVYWSNDDPDVISSASDRVLGWESVNWSGPVSPTANGLVISPSGQVTVDNVAVQWDTTHHWSLAMSVALDTLGSQVLLQGTDEALAYSLSFDSGVWTWTAQDPEQTQTVTLDFPVQVGEPVGVVVSWDADARVLHLAARSRSTPLAWSTGQFAATSGMRPTKIKIGAASGFTLKALSLSQGALMEPGSDILESWADQVDSWPLRGSWSDDGHTVGMILRYHPSLYSDDYPTSMLGGPGDFWEDVTWTPIPREYRLNKGYVRLPPTRARFWKIEFGALYPEPYHPFLTTSKMVRLIPRLRNAMGGDFDHSRVPGLKTLVDFPREFVDAPQDGLLDPGFRRQVGPPVPTLPTDVVAPVDHTNPIWNVPTRANDAIRGWQGWQSPAFTVMFPTTGKHHYTKVSMPHSGGVGYFVGVKAIKAFRTDFTAEDDLQVINDTLEDLHNLDMVGFPTTFAFDPGFLYSSHDAPSVATSKGFRSNHKVSAIQIASQQTPPVQVLPNDDFRDAAVEPNLVEGSRATLRTIKDADGRITALQMRTYGVSLAEVNAVVNSEPGVTVSAPDADGVITVDADATGGDTGTASAGGASTLTDATKTWTVNQWAGKTVTITGGTGSGQTRTITSNTATALTVSVNWGTNPDNTSTYAIVKINANVDHVWDIWYALRRSPTEWHTYGDSTASWDQATHSVRILRNRGPESLMRGVDGWEVQPPIDPVFSFREGDLQYGSLVGGLESPFVRVSPRGSVSAAVRLTPNADVDPDHPLVLQILGASGVVLASKTLGQRYVEAGAVRYRLPADQEIEESVTYQIGSLYNNGAYPTWTPLRDVAEPTVHPVANDTPLTDAGTHTAGWPMRVRIIQSGASTLDVSIDRLSLFDEAILWEVSNDNGTSWVEVGPGVRNNPNGAVSFPTVGNVVRWRATAYRTGMAITAVQLRPWYTGRSTWQHYLAQRGPNVSIYDIDPPVDQDPMFRQWDKMVPQWWWRAGAPFVTSMPLEVPWRSDTSREHVRSEGDDLSGIADAATIGMVYARSVDEALSIADSVGQVSTLNRSLAESAPADDTGLGWTTLGGTWEIG